MRKFTVFTVILAITVIVTVSEMFVNNYLPNLGSGEGEELTLTLPQSLDLSKIVKTDTLGASESVLSNKLGADLEVKDESKLPNTDLIENFEGSYDSAIPTGLGEEKIAVDPTDEPSKQTDPQVADTGDEVGDFEDQSFSVQNVNVNLRQEQIDSAGFFGAYIEEEESDGKLYKTIDVADLYDTKMQKFVIRSEEELMAKVYIFSVGANSNIDELYQLIKSRCGLVPVSTVNETNEYGNGSFYLNDSSRSGTVFLTAKMGELVYGFSYPKTYHSQVKNLVQLLAWELG